MPDYQKMYITLFNQITDAIKALQEAQRQSEELYMAEELRVVSGSRQLSEPE